VVRLAEIVFKVQANVPGRFIVKRCKVLVITMGAVVSKLPRPGRSKFPGEWFNHESQALKVLLVIESQN
jgi:hypothetical protein